MAHAAHDRHGGMQGASGEAGKPMQGAAGHWCPLQHCPGVAVLPFLSAAAAPGFVVAGGVDEPHLKPHIQQDHGPPPRRAA